MTMASLAVPELGRANEETIRGLGRLPELSLAMAAGSAIIAIAFAGARYGRPWAGHLFWLGQIVIYFAPAAFLLLRKRTSAIEAAGIALLVSVTTYLINQYYSPGQFRFSDEFQHVQTAQSILATHHLFHVNTILPQSPQYPGLEIITTNIVSLTHLSITTAGLIVSGAAHVLAAMALYFLIFEISQRPRVAALVVVVYATGSHYQFFDSYFIYETIAIPFLLLSLLATVKMMKSRGRVMVGWGAVAVVSGAVTAVCHHVTSYALVGLLLAFVLAQPFVQRTARNKGLVVVFLAVVAIVAVWDLRVATSTVAYFRPVIDSIFRRHTGASSPSGGIALFGTPGLGQPPRIDTVGEYLAFVVLMVLTALGALKLWFSRRAALTGAALGLAIASLSLFVVLALRVVASNGSELSSRALTFTLVPVGFVCALVLVDRTVRRSRSALVENERGSILLALVSTLVVVCIAVGGIAGGWPTYFARLPGPYKVDAWERSVDHHNLDAAQWFANLVPRDQGVASDFSTEALISALGHQAEVQGIAGLFLPLRYSIAQGRLARSKRVSFIAVDRRITRQRPATGYYFTDEPKQDARVAPLPTRSITKFDDIPGVSRVYDDGTIEIYEIVGSEYYK